MKKVFNLIIVDESGSMGIIEKQALMGLNETLEVCEEDSEGSSGDGTARDTSHL